MTKKIGKFSYHDPIVSSGTSHCRSGRGKQPEYGNYYSGNRRDPDLYGKSEIRAVPVDGGCRGRISGDFSGDWKVIAWSGWRSGGIRNSLKKGIRRCRDFMPSVPAVCSGRGWARAFRSWDFLPEAQNDMIFSIICEELGLVGAGLILLLFLLMIWRFFVIATHARDLFGALIAAGAMAHMMIQVILNIAVVTNSIPNTGITLPFVSYGGTSVVFLLIEMGLVLSVSNLIE